MTKIPGFRVRLVDWRSSAPVLCGIRTTVFVGEQNVPPASMDSRSRAIAF